MKAKRYAGCANVRSRSFKTPSFFLSFLSCIASFFRLRCACLKFNFDFTFPTRLSSFVFRLSSLPSLPSLLFYLLTNQPKHNLTSLPSPPFPSLPSPPLPFPQPNLRFTVIATYNTTQPNLTFALSVRTEVFDNGRSGVLERELTTICFLFSTFFFADDDDGRVSEIILLVSRLRSMATDYGLWL